MRTTKHKQLTLVAVLVLMLVSALGARVYGQAELPADQTKLQPSQNDAQLVQADGVEAVQRNCLACHTAQPILTHNGFTSKTWQKEIEKMRKQYGCKVSDEDAAVILAYLTKWYSDDPVSPDNVLLHGANTTPDQEPIIADQPVIKVNQKSATPEASPSASPAATPAK